MAKARSMRIRAKLPHDLWQETVNTAVYLYNRTPRYANDWQTPYERFYTYLSQQEGTGNTARKPQLAHLKAYGCRAYAMMPEKLAANKSIVQEDDDLISLYNGEDEDTIVVNTGHLEMGQDSHEDTIVVRRSRHKVAGI
jgi:hypothetical protein